MKVFFYTRSQCELCKEGYELVKLVQQELHFTMEVIEIEEDQQIHEQYSLMIPVVETQKGIIQYGQLDYVTLYEALSK